MSDYPMWFHQSTKFVTENGIKSFLDFENNDKVNVYNLNGELEEGTIIKADFSAHDYVINTFNLGGDESKKPNGHLNWAKFLTKKEVITYGGDLWYLNNGRRAKSIKIGEYLRQAPKNSNNLFIDLKSPEWFLNGIIFAVGKDYVQWNGSVKIQEGCWFIIGEEFYNNNKDLLNYVGVYAYHYSELPYYLRIISISEYDMIVMIRGPQKREKYLNMYEWNKCPDYYKADAFEGYLLFKHKKYFNEYKDTEGRVIDKDNRFIINEYDERVVKFIKDCSQFAGYRITSITEKKERSTASGFGYDTPNHNENPPYHTDDKIISTTFKKYKNDIPYWEIVFEGKTQRDKNRIYRLESKTNTYYEEDSTPCTIDTESGSFILANGIIGLSKPFEPVVN